MSVSGTETQEGSPSIGALGVEMDGNFAAPLSDFEIVVAKRAKEWALEQVKKRLDPKKTEKDATLSLEGMACLLYPPFEAFSNPNPADFALQGTYVYLLDYSATFPHLQIVLRCPNCSNVLSSDGWSPTATAKCCYDIDRTHHILQKLYTCLECNTNKNANELHQDDTAGSPLKGSGNESRVSFLASSQEITRQVPPSVLPPIIVTAEAAVTKTVQRMVQRNVINGKTFQDESDTLTEMHRARHYEQMKSYYQYMVDINKIEQKRATCFGSNVSQKDPFPKPKTGEFRVCLGPQYLINIYLSVFRNRQEHLARCLESTGGRMLGVDHLFQTVKHINDGESLYMFMPVNSASNNKRVMKGTSKSEGFNNQLAKALVGNRFSVELASALMADYIHCWNIDKAADSIGSTDNYGCYDTLLLEEINDICKSLKSDALPFPQLNPEVPAPTKVPQTLTLDISEEMITALKPPSGEQVLNGASVERDACVIIEEVSCEPTLLFPTQNVITRNIQANSVATPVVSQSGAQESKRMHSPSINLPSAEDSSSQSSIKRHRGTAMHIQTKEPTAILPVTSSETPCYRKHFVRTGDYTRSQEEAMMLGNLVNPQLCEMQASANHRLLDALSPQQHRPLEEPQNDSFDCINPLQDLSSIGRGSLFYPSEGILAGISDLPWHGLSENLFALSKFDIGIKAPTPEKKKFYGRGAPNKPRNCRKCKKPLRNKGRDPQACSCYSNKRASE